MYLMCIARVTVPLMGREIPTSTLKVTCNPENNNTSTTTTTANQNAQEEDLNLGEEDGV